MLSNPTASSFSPRRAPRSPWTNEFVPPLADGEASALPSARLRQLEQLANATFDVYREQYYDGGVSSAYFWDLDGRPADFAACVCFRKDAAAVGRAGTGEGRWDAVHVFEVAARGPGESCSYKLTSTVMLSVANADAGELKLAGSITRQVRARGSRRCSAQLSLVASVAGERAAR